MFSILRSFSKRTTSHALLLLFGIVVLYNFCLSHVRPLLSERQELSAILRHANVLSRVVIDHAPIIACLILILEIVQVDDFALPHGVRLYILVMS